MTKPWSEIQKQSKLSPERQAAIKETVAEHVAALEAKDEQIRILREFLRSQVESSLEFQANGPPSYTDEMMDEGIAEWVADEAALKRACDEWRAEDESDE